MPSQRSRQSSGSFRWPGMPWFRRRLPAPAAACPVPSLIAPPPRLAPPPPLDTGAIRRSLTGMTAGATVLAGDFYGYLFSVCPHLRDMFPAQMTGQNERLFRALMRIIALLDDPDRLATYLTQLGADHRKYQVKPEHYAPVGEALICALRRHCPHWDDAAEAAWTAAYQVAADAMIAGAAGVRGPAVWKGRVVRHERRTRDVAVLQVHTGEPIPWMAGQYVTIQTGKWQRVWRPYSIACAPGGDENIIELHVRAVGGGWVSTALVRDTGPDDEIVIGPPVGTMTPEAIGDRDLVCVAGGTGLAPLKAIVTQVLAEDEAAVAGGYGMRRNITLFHGVRTPMDLYEAPLLHSLASAYPWFQAVPVVSDDPRFNGPCGDVADVALARGGWQDRDAFISGPLNMVTGAVCGFREAGLPASRVHFDDIEAQHPS